MRPLGTYTTIAIGPDGKVYDLSKVGFPARSDYIPVNAYTVRIERVEKT